jgi:hypothetical protein
MAVIFGGGYASGFITFGMPWEHEPLLQCLNIAHRDG